MDPITATLGVVGLGMQVFGGLAASGVAKQEAQVSSDEAAQEQNINNTKQAAMRLNAQRTQMENIRNNQRARAQATNSATNQGAQFGSGLQGGLAQVNDQSTFNMLGVNQALQTGAQIGNFNNLISQDKIQMAGLGGQMATDQGIASMGAGISKAAPMIGPMTQLGFGAVKSSNIGQGLFGGGSPSGYGNGNG